MKALTKPLSKKLILLVSISFFIFSGCQKFDWFDHHNNGHGHLKQTNDYSSEVALKWMDMQLRLIRTNAIPRITARTLFCLLWHSALRISSIWHACLSNTVRPTH